jgi:FkbM family methyltransferase
MYHSQIGQDKLLHQTYFKNLSNGIFLDIGAHDGIDASNTYFFEKELGWTGICVEPNPNVFSKLQKNRASKCFPYAISDIEGELDFVKVSGYAEMLSGLLNAYDPRHIQRIQRDLRGGTTEIIKVKSIPLSKLLKNEAIHEIHYMSLDVEGAELSVLNSIDFTNVFIHVIDIENNYPDTFGSIESFLFEKGYVKTMNIEWDVIFVHKNSNLLPK